MKKCLVCGTTARPVAPTCPACGSADWKPLPAPPAPSPDPKTALRRGKVI